MAHLKILVPSFRLETQTFRTQGKTLSYVTQEWFFEQQQLIRLRPG